MEYIKHMVRLELYAILSENASPFLKIFRQDSTKFDKRFDNACNRCAKMRKVRRKRKGRKKLKDGIYGNEIQ